MEDIIEEIKYDLKKSFGYAHKGEQREAEFITLQAPNVDNVGFAAKLKQGFMKALAGQQRTREVNASHDDDSDQEDPKNPGENLEDMSGEMLMALLSMSDIDYPAYLHTSVAVFSAKGIALVDGEEPIKKGMMDKMSVEDLEAMTGEYLKAFILTSVSEMMQT